jgi:hypothetical protein
MGYKEKFFSFLIFNDITTILNEDEMKVDVEAYYKYVMTTIPCAKID